MTAIEGTLTSTGWLPWEEIRELLDTDDCLWLDVGGVHRGRAPERPPIATHLWSWGSDRWVRIRLDGDRALAASFIEGMHPDHGDLVSGSRAVGVPWGRYGRAADWDEPATMLTLDGAGAITFVRLEPT